MERTFKFTIDGVAYHAKMIDNPLVEKIVAMCPFEADYERYTEHEYFTRLPKSGSQEGCEPQLISHAAANMRIGNEVQIENQKGGFE